MIPGVNIHALKKLKTQFSCDSNWKKLDFTLRPQSLTSAVVALALCSFPHVCLSIQGLCYSIYSIEGWKCSSFSGIRIFPMGEAYGRREEKSAGQVMTHNWLGQFEEKFSTSIATSSSWPLARHWRSVAAKLKENSCFLPRRGKNSFGGDGVVWRWW